MEVQLNQKKITWAWTMYDWANSVFSLTIATAIFPPYFEAVTKAAAIAQGGNPAGPFDISIWGWQINNSSAYSYALSLGFLLVTILSPILSGIADTTGNKKIFLKFFCYLGSLSCIGLFFFNEHSILLGLTLFVLSVLGFGGSIVFYNAYLPEIVSEDRYDRVSARGFSMGYIGSVILLIFNLVTLLKPEWFFAVQAYADELVQNGTEPVTAMQLAKDHYVNLSSRLAFVSVGLWWMGFAQIPFRYLPDTLKAADQTQGNVIGKGWRELKKVYSEIRLNNAHNHLKRFLWGFFFLSMGVQTVMYVASLFGAQVLNLPTQDLIITILLIQLIGIAGAWLFSRISERIGNIYALLIMGIIWVGICVGAYFITTAYEFYLIGAVVGMVMGGIQSILRSTYAKLIPDATTDHASYFSFYDVTEKVAIVLGTFCYGLIIELTGNMRNSVISLLIFFVIGLYFMARIKNFKTFHP